MNVYGKITILSEKRVKSKVFCRCECGTEKWINIFNLKRGDVKSCGCLKKERMKDIAKQRFTGKTSSNFQDYTGKKIGLCTVIRRVIKESPDTCWLLKCECGTEFEVTLSTLRRSTYEKCRCGFPTHPLKATLQKMIDRCVNINCRYGKWYIQKGISVCNEWLKFPIKFIEWSIKNGWKKGLTIDRIDSNGNYEPSNCQWITREENASKAAKERWEQNSLA